jgi:hypothetical protein
MFHTLLAFCRSKGIEECEADCIEDDRCGCGFFRVDDTPDGGQAWCALTTVPCDQPSIGATHDYALLHWAHYKCDYSPSDKAEQNWDDDPYEQVDWYGIWDFVCEVRHAELVLSVTLRP